MIDNLATATYVNSARSELVSAPSNVVRVTVASLPTSAVLEFLRFAPLAPVVEQVLVPPTFYSPSGNLDGPFIALLPPTVTSSFIDLSRPVPLVSTTVYHRGDPIFLRLTDFDQNLDSLAIDTVVVTVRIDDVGEREVLRLHEISENAGVFSGYVQSGSATPLAMHDGFVSPVLDVQIDAVYNDPRDATDTAADGAWVEPLGIVFDSRTGQPLDGAQVALVDAVTGQPATVLGDDGVSSFPSQLLTGATVTDGNDRPYHHPPGGYRFPVVQPGTYRVVVTPQAGYAAPSAVSTPDLQSLPGAPYDIADPGSRAEVFTIGAASLVGFDIPVDAVQAALRVQKTAGISLVAIGDFVEYAIRVENLNAAAAASVQAVDRLPAGFRYQPGSLRRDGVPIGDPAVSADGRTLTVALGDLAAATVTTLRYVCEVGAGARLGDALNRVTVRDGAGTQTDASSAVVRVREDLFRRRSFIHGRVLVGECQDQPVRGLGGVRILLEDGTWTVTDGQGRYHFEGVLAGSHVVQLDPETLPPDFDLLACETHSRFAGSASSQIVSLQGGTLWRADFRVAHRPPPPPPPPEPPTGAVGLKLGSRVRGSAVVHRVSLEGQGVPVANRRLTVALFDGARYVAGSSRLDGSALADPEQTGNMLTYRLGDAPADWRAAFELESVADSVARDSAVGTEHLVTKAFLMFDTPAASNRRTPVVADTVRLEQGWLRHRRPDIVVRPRFASFMTELSDADRAELDRVANELRERNVVVVHVSGHTDSIRIAPRSRKIFADNTALSYARARSVATYLQRALAPLEPRFEIEGYGPDHPVATNRTRAGRQQNRRVELRLVSEVVTHERSLEAGGPTDSAAVDITGVFEDLAAAADSVKAAPAPPALAAVWIEMLEPGNAWIWPPPAHHPAIPSTRVIVQHGTASTPRLTVNGKALGTRHHDGRLANKAGTVAVSAWAGIDLAEGDNTIVVELGDGARLERVVHYSGPPVDAELDVTRSHLSIDGRSVPVIAVRLTDRDGHPARKGVVGSFSIDPPYASRQEMDALRRNPLTGHTASRAQYEVGLDGIALIELEPTLHAGEAVVRLQLENGEHEIRAWLASEPRDWILVGLAEGSIGYDLIAGGIEPAAEAGVEEQVVTDGRIALFAKGRVRGEWLLTLAVDTRQKPDEKTRLHQVIDPDEYYMLYGDATAQAYDAPTSRHLYLRIERRQFYALFGDFDSDLTVTELTRYDRSLNGFKSEYRGNRGGFGVFVSPTANRFVKDEIRGEGVSGLYRLSRNDIVINSERVRVQTRDRFRSERIVEDRTLRRHLDYDIDYEAGTLFFRTPVPSRDANLNPVFIVADYEVVGTIDRHLDMGGRASARLTRELEAGVSYLQEDQPAGPHRLGGLDARYDLGRGTELRGELAWSRRPGLGDGNAFLLALLRRAGRASGQAYVRRQSHAYGLGQQNVSERGTEKYGLDVDVAVAAGRDVAGQLYRQTNLETGAERDVGQLSFTQKSGAIGLRLGARHAVDRLPGRSDRRSSQLTGGANAYVLRGRVMLRADHEQSLGGRNDNADFPTRTILGADVEAWQRLSLFVTQEFTHGTLADTRTTLLGLRAAPWQGGEVLASMGRAGDEFGPRIHANLGLRQTWRIGPRWFLDATLDRSQTLGSPDTVRLNERVPPASGSTQDFTALSLGTAFHSDIWQFNVRGEVLAGEVEDRWSLSPAVLVEPRRGLGLAAGGRAFLTRGPIDHAHADLRLGLSWQPTPYTWALLDRLDLVVDEEQGVSGLDSRRIVNNLNLNRRFSRGQLALQYGSKYVAADVGATRVSGYTDLIGVEARYDLTDRWDLGAFTSVLHSWNLRTYDFRAGLSVGLNVVHDVWAQAGYNFAGFEDRDFSAGSYTAHGPFLRLTVRFDDDALALLGLGYRAGEEETR